MTTPRKTVAVDLDGVLADFSEGWKGVEHIGAPIAGAVEFLRTLSTVADVLIWTTRCNPELGRGMSAGLLRNLVRDWLDANGFAGLYADIYVGPVKPIAAAFVDDRAVSCRPQDGPWETPLGAYLLALGRVERLIADSPPGCSLHHMRLQSAVNTSTDSHDAGAAAKAVSDDEIPHLVRERQEAVIDRLTRERDLARAECLAWRTAWASWSDAFERPDHTHDDGIHWDGTEDVCTECSLFRAVKAAIDANLMPMEAT